MPAQFLSAVILLLLVVDPFGNVPLVNAMLADVPLARRRNVVVRECGIAFMVLAAFMAFGPEILAVMHLSETSLSIAGGVILFMIAIRMVFAHPEGAFGLQQGRGEPLIVPLAIPLIAGPSALATVMLLASREPRELGMLAAALVVAMGVTTTVLLAGERLQRWMGDRGMQAMARLMGLILTAIAVEMLLGGIRAFVEGMR
ncbi:MAG TPA: MarC family protein [Usitatibacter sp.]|jgi:MarC family membrane protein|nr:MarC family protein [Usitatibacter sp.]